MRGSGVLLHENVKPISSGGLGKPPSTPCSPGFSVSSRKRFQLSSSSWIATTIQPSAVLPAKWWVWPSGRAVRRVNLLHRRVVVLLLPVLEVMDDSVGHSVSS